MKHAEKLAEKILFLKGEPTSKLDANPKKGQEIPEILATDMALKAQAVKGNLENFYSIWPWTVEVPILWRRRGENGSNGSSFIENLFDIVNCLKLVE